MKRGRKNSHVPREHLLNDPPLQSYQFVMLHFLVKARTVKRSKKKKEKKIKTRKEKLELRIQSKEQM